MTLTDIDTLQEHEIENYDGEVNAPDYMADVIGNTGAVALEDIDRDKVCRAEYDRILADDYKRCGNHGSYIVSDCDGNNYCTMADIQWWIDFTNGMRKATSAQSAIEDYISDNLDDYDVEDLTNYIQSGSYLDTDLEYQPDAILRALGDWVNEIDIETEQKTEMEEILKSN